MLDQFIPGSSARTTPPVPPLLGASQPASATMLPEIIQALDRLSAGLETGRIYDRHVVTLGPALDRLGNHWVRRTSREGRFPWVSSVPLGLTYADER